MRCQSCDHDNRAERRFCAECGAALAARCAACGASNEPGEKFCGGCGERLRPAALLPAAPAIAVSMPAPAPEAALPAGERRQLTVLFCDLVGSTPLSQQLDAEEWRDLIAQYQQAASGAVARFGGHVAKNLGDGLLIYFGWPTAREDDPERAVRAGLAIVDAVRAVKNPPVSPFFKGGEEAVPSSFKGGVEGVPSFEKGGLGGISSDAAELHVRVGMHTGPVVIADGGEVFGETANVAARVQGAAEPDTVVITAATQRLVAGLFVVEDRGAQHLKGVREPVTLYRVVQPSGVRSRLAVAAGHLTRFVGRDMEFGTLVDRWERAQDGEGQNVVVLGEAGVGKSRLVYQLHEHLADVPHTWLECGATPYTEGTPFHPVIALTTQALAFAPEDTATEKLGKLEGGLRDLVSAENVALLADFLGLPPPTRLQMSPELQRRKTIDLLAQWNLSLSAVQPLVLFVEDLHWCDVSTLELLGHLMAQSPTARVLLLATARPEFTPPWPARSNLTTVQLARLTKRQARDMIATLARTELPAATLETLVARADGVPLYVEELTKAVMEPGAAHGVEAIPASLADSLMARLDRLSAAKEVAQRAAVLGREFAYPLLAETAGMDEAALRQGLARLIDAEILFARGEPPAATYTFKHALIQETAYQSLLKRTRQQLHQRIAQVLTDRLSEVAANQPELVARHYTEGGLGMQAINYWYMAGQRAVQCSANLEAIGYLGKALGLLTAAPVTSERTHMELALQTLLGLALMSCKGYGAPEVEAAFRRARELCHDLGDAAQPFPVLRGLWAFAIVRGRLSEARELAGELLDTARVAGDDAFLLEACYALGCTLFYLGEPGASLSWSEQGIALYAPALHRSHTQLYGADPGVTCRCYAAVVLWQLGHADQALVRAQEARALAEETGQPVNVAFALAFGAIVHQVRGDVEAAHAWAEEAVALATEQVLPFWASMARIFRGWAWCKEGRSDLGIAEIERGLAESRAAGAEVGRPQNCVLLGEVFAAKGDCAAGLAALAEALDAVATTGARYQEAELHHLRGQILLTQPAQGGGEALYAEVEACFRSGIEVARRQEARGLELRAATSLARLWQRQGKGDEARDLLAPVYEWFTEGFDTRDLKDAQALLAELGS